MKAFLKKQKQKLNTACLAAAVLHWFLSLFTDHFIFQYVMWDFSGMTQTIKTVMTWGAKAVFLLVLIGIWQGLYYFVKKADRRFVYCTLFYFALNLCLLIFTWPGIWRMDEFGILNSAVLLLPVFWQNYITSVFYVFSLMLLPFPAGVIIVQCACVSLATGYMVLWFVKQLGAWGYLSFLPFCFLPVLDSNLYPMRMSLYAFLELLLLLVIYGKYLRTADNKSGIIKMKGYFRMPQIGKNAICLLAAVVTVWRTEAIYYVVLFPVLMWILFHKKWSGRSLIKLIGVYLGLTLVLYLPQKLGDTFTNGEQYDLTSVVLPLVPLTEKAYMDYEADGRSCREELAAIDKVVNVELLIKGAEEGKSGISLFWGESGFQRDGYGKEEYAQFKKAYYRLILKYPSVFLQERWTCFLQSVDLLQNTTELFLAEDVPNYEKFRTYPLTKPINNNLRNSIISFLEWRCRTDYTQKKNGYYFIYGAFCPLLFLIVCWIGCLIRRKWAEFFIISLPLFKLPLIFLTAPSRLFMYYYSLYLIGWVLFFYILLRLFTGLWEKISAPVGKTLRYARRNGIKKAYYAAKERIDHTHMDALSKKAAEYVGSRVWSYPEHTKGQGEAQSNMLKAAGIKISLVVPAYETNSRYLRELIASVKNQTYPDWELIIADASRSDTVKNVICREKDREEMSNCQESGQKQTPAGQIKYIRLKENKGIAENTNAAIEAAEGDFIALLDHDDILTWDALEKMLACLLETEDKDRRNVLAVYSDEDKCDGEAAHFYEPNFKPDFNLDLLLSNNYICHFLMVKADVMKALKLRPEYDGAQDYDLLLRLAGRTKAAADMIGKNPASGDEKILHAPYVLYHWRCHESSTAVNTDSKRYAYDAGRKALQDFYKSMGMEESVVVTDSEHLGFYTTTYKPDIFSVRKDVAALCGRVIENGIVTASPEHLFDGLTAYSSGYLHRAGLRMEVREPDERALCIRPDLKISLEEALKRGMKLLYDPQMIYEA